MAQNAGRITCPRCGANNFDTVSACWRCQTPLAGAMPGAAPAGSPPAASVGGAFQDRPAPSAAYPPVRSNTGDPGAARRAAIALALTIPFIGLPVGWVFMMIEDERKQAVGRICVIWSCISLVLQLLLMFAAGQSLAPALQAALKLSAKAAQQSQNADPSGGGSP